MPGAATSSGRSRSSRRPGALLEESGNRTATLLADARMAEALQLGGEYDRAAELAARTLEHAAGDEGSSLVRPVLNRVLGQAHLLAGRLDAAREALELAIAEANRVEHRYEEALALAALSRIGERLERGVLAPRCALRAARHRRLAGAAGSQPDSGGREARSWASLPRCAAQPPQSFGS